MSWLHVGPEAFDADLVVFDKDGTLIDFEYAWGRQVVAGVERLLTAVGGSNTLRQDLYRSLGYDAQTGRTDGTGPLAMASMEKLYTIAAAVLYQHGFTWDEAEAHVGNYFEAGMASIPLREVVRPVANVKALLAGLQGANVRVAVVTTDDRLPTQETMALLGIEGLVDFLACGDDPIPLKPAPDAVLQACAHLGIEPARTLVVGDTVTDMLMAARAGAGCRAAVLTGAGSRDSLVAYTNLVLNSVAQIRVSPRDAGL
ncbi:MAG: HAD family hydrolase [Anaerolineae bacterium]